MSNKKPIEFWIIENPMLSGHFICRTEPPPGLREDQYIRAVEHSLYKKLLESAERMRWLLEDVYEYVPISFLTKAIRKIVAEFEKIKTELEQIKCNYTK